jgi:hypothetical protein
VVDRQRGHDDVERAGRQLLRGVRLEVGVWQETTCMLKHGVALVDPNDHAVAIARRYAIHIHTSTGAQIEDPRRVDVCGRLRDGVLHAVVCEDLRLEGISVGVEIELKLLACDQWMLRLQAAAGAADLSTTVSMAGAQSPCQCWP